MASVSFDWEKSWPAISVSRALSASISGVVLARRAASRCSALLPRISASPKADIVRGALKRNASWPLYRYIRFGRNALRRPTSSYNSRLASCCS
jgi:hypothetical protein